MLLKIVVDLQTLPEGDAHGKKVTPKDRHEKRKKEIRSFDTVLVFLSGPIRAHNHGPQLQETQPADLVGECEHNLDISLNKQFLRHCERGIFNPGYSIC